MKEILKQQFQASYKRDAFEKNVLRPIFQGKVNEYVILDDKTAFSIPLTDGEKTIAKSITKYGHIVTADDRKIELYEVVLKDDKVVERNKVSIGALVKKQIIGNNAIFVNFTYENPVDKNWRFSFIAFDSVFEDGDIKTIETNPKRYTYIFGEPDETYKTAVDCFSKLANELEIKIVKIKDAFGVEAMSKAFFDEYRDTHYKNFVNHLIHSNFKKSAFDGDEKAIRDFVKKLLGRIVFLYFLQKKGWLGATTLDYNDGDKNFISNFFKEAKQGADFYPVWLSKLFFDTLNEKRKEDNFTMPDDSVVKIPYLNGGLFEKDSDKTDFITFEPELFASLFDFFDQYNFTVYEDSPDDHTIAVDPEMLGHIFENLLEDNKDKGAFYTPKQIVQYMTQESLIEYLNTHLSTEKDKISNYIKDSQAKLTTQELKDIDVLLDNVKICDPAIGSGAFPMGLLQEIFSLKERIAFELGFKVWSPATVKENIIQNSIYGVDIEKGAVDIARLRFWLSLIVDEDLPKALPNLDYKIVVGNSLVSKFEDEVIEIDWNIKEGTQNNLFGSSLEEDKQKLLKEISDKQKQFFHTESKDKKKLAFEIRITKIKLLSKQIELMIETKGFKEDRGQILNKKQLDAKLETESWKNTLEDLKRLEKNSNLPFNHFDWKLDFPEILNPLVTDKITGFDIVIGNPPYIVYEGKLKNQIEHILRIDIYQKCKGGKINAFELFLAKTHELVKLNGINCQIFQNSFLADNSSRNLREFYFKNENIIKIDSFPERDNQQKRVFESVKMSVCILFSKNKILDNYSFDVNFWKDKFMQDGYTTSFYVNEIFLFDEKQLIIPNLKSEEKDIFQRYYSLNNSYSDYFKCLEGELNMTFHKDYMTTNPLNPLIVKGAQIQRYYVTSNPSQGEIMYVDKGKYLKDYIKSEKSRHHKNERIALQGISGANDKIRLISTIIPKDVFCANSCNYIIKNDEEYDCSIRALLGIFNSKLTNWVFKKSSTNSNVNCYEVNNLRLPKSNKKGFELIDIIVEYILALKNLITPINSNVPNSHLVETFEEIIDSIVFEMYFPEDFKHANIHFIEFGIKDFRKLDDLDVELQKEIIHETYQKLREKTNEIRNNIKLMKIELRDLLMPILTT